MNINHDSTLTGQTLRAAKAWVQDSAPVAREYIERLGFTRSEWKSTMTLADAYEKGYFNFSF